MQLRLQTFTSMVSDMRARASSVLADLAPGSVTNTLLEATASVSLWLQYVALQVLLATRLSTSSGDDIDSFVGDFGLTRLPAIAATGTVTLGRYAPSTGVTVPVGSLVRTGDASQSFEVYADTASPLWDTTAIGYVIPAGVVSGDVPVVALVPGTTGNVGVGTINLSGGIAGISTVTNAAVLVDGKDAETDDAVRVRFADYIASLEKATVTAVRAAIEGVQQGIAFTVTENIDEQGAFKPGHFVVRASDGTGVLPPALATAIYLAVDRVRPIGSTFSVQPPTIRRVNVTLTLVVNAGTSKALLLAPVAAAVTAYVNGLQVGETLAVSRIAFVTYGVDLTAIRSVGAVRIDGVADDLVPAATEIIRIATVTVN